MSCCLIDEAYSYDVQFRKNNSSSRNSLSQPQPGSLGSVPSIYHLPVDVGSSPMHVEELVHSGARS